MPNNNTLRLARRKYAFDTLGNKCIRCNSTENLEIDHIKPETKNPKLKRYIGGNISIWKLTDKEFLLELPKCQLLCFKCHNIKSILDAGKIPSHNQHNYSRYSNYGCRCNICKGDASKHRKERYLRLGR